MSSIGWAANRRPEPAGGEEAYDDTPGAFTRFVEFLRPDEGFAGLLLVLTLAGLVGWSIADARWILGRDELTSFLIYVAIAGAAWGWISSRLQMSPWLAQTLGAVVAAVAIIELTGMRMPNATPGLAGWAQAAAYSATQAYLDLTWRHQASTLQYGHFCIVLGILVWGTAQAASYDIFGYRRAVNGVLLLAVVFVANMSLTAHDQFVALVAFSAAALALLILAHGADERSNWVSHRIWRGHDFGARNLEAGLSFASLAVVGALILTAVASSAPLANAASQLDIQNSLSWLNGFLPQGGQTRYQPNARFGNNFAVGSTFHASNDPQFTIRVAEGPVSLHWRVVSYDHFDTTGWSLGQTATDQVPAGAPLDQGTVDEVLAETPGRVPLTVSVHVIDTGIRSLIAANEPNATNIQVGRTTVGSPQTSLNASSWSTDATDYIVSTYVPNIDPTGKGLTEWDLRQAGNEYPPGLVQRFTQGTDKVGAPGRALLARIKEWAATKGNKFANAYDVAKAIQDYLRSPDNFRYSADISSLMPQCTGLSTVDCFAVIKQGFCQQYATTMAMLVRLEGYPARWDLGYLPGSVKNGLETVTAQQMHAWVEVYFPNYGWIPFDPTGGPGRPTQLPAGQPQPVATPTPKSTGPDSTSRYTLKPRVPTDPNSSGTTDNGSGIPVFLPLVLAILIGALGYARWRRKPQRQDPPDVVFRRVVRLASRLGFRPKPTQTVYEYAGMLARVVPMARDELGVVATAHVETQYGRRHLTTHQMTLLGRAQRTVEQALWRLLLRLPFRRDRQGETKS